MPVTRPLPTRRSPDCPQRPQCCFSIRTRTRTRTTCVMRMRNETTEAQRPEANALPTLRAPKRPLAREPSALDDRRSLERRLSQESRASKGSFAATEPPENRETEIRDQHLEDTNINQVRFVDPLFASMVGSAGDPQSLRQRRALHTSGAGKSRPSATRRSDRRSWSCSMATFCVQLRPPTPAHRIYER